MTDRLHVLISGRVQGVGFRYATWDQAELLGLTGWVRNLHDRRVEAEFEGTRAALEAMLAWCRRGPAGAHVTEVTVHWEQGELLFQDFSIRR